MMLYRKVLYTKYDQNTWREISCSVKERHKKLTAVQYEQLLQYMEEVHLDELPHRESEMMIDGAQWVIERVTNQGFKAYFTNVAGEDIRQVYSFLTKLSGKKTLGYMEEYTF